MLFAFTLAALVKLLIVTEKPGQCVAIYTGFVFIFSLVGLLAEQITLGAAALGVVLAFLLSFAYFSALNRLELGSGGWWFVMLAGALAAFVI